MHAWPCIDSRIVPGPRDLLVLRGSFPVLRDPLPRYSMLQESHEKKLEQRR